MAVLAHLDPLRDGMPGLTIVAEAAGAAVPEPATPLLAAAGVEPVEDPDTSRKLILGTRDADVKLVIIRAADVLRQPSGPRIGSSRVTISTVGLLPQIERYTEEGHPAARGKDPGPHRNAIEEHYRHNDAFVGEVMAKLEKGDMLVVLSDHGFTSFRRGVNLNAWLLANGYLKLKEGRDGSAEWLRDVDWSATKAYALGLAGMFLNVKGRESEGIVEPGEQCDDGNFSNNDACLNTCRFAECGDGLSEAHRVL